MFFDSEIGVRREAKDEFEKIESAIGGCLGAGRR